MEIEDVDDEAFVEVDKNPNNGLHIQVGDIEIVHIKYEKDNKF